MKNMWKGDSTKKAYGNLLTQDAFAKNRGVKKDCGTFKI